MIIILTLFRGLYECGALALGSEVLLGGTEPDCLSVEF